MKALATTLWQMRSAVEELTAKAAACSQLADRVLGHQARWVHQQGAKGSLELAEHIGPGRGRSLWTAGERRPGAAAAQRLLRAPPQLLQLALRPPGAPLGGAGGGARRFSGGPDRDELIDQRLGALSQEHEAMQRQLHDGSVPPSSERFQALSRRAGQLQVVADGFAEIQRLKRELAGAEEIFAGGGAGDEELREMAREERGTLRAQLSELRESLVAHLLPPDDDDDRNAVLEVRGGVGGEWAAAFAGDLLAMYRSYAAAQGWQFELLSAAYNDHGGVKAADAMVTGPGAFGRLRWESGVHRAQAVPFTEKTGKVQTGTATVAVLAEASESDVTIAESDLKWDTFRASGAGGQHVNTTDSAVRVTHGPTGVVVACQSERSQHQNRAKALRLLRSKVQEAERAKAAASVNAARQQAHGGARFNERIRTFHYVDGRVTDHRVPGLSIMGGVERVLSGDMLGDLIGAVAAAKRDDALEELLAAQQAAGGGEAAAAAAAAG